jgi:hypothetical protein
MTEQRTKSIAALADLRKTLSARAEDRHNAAEHVAHYTASLCSVVTTIDALELSAQADQDVDVTQDWAEIWCARLKDMKHRYAREGFSEQFSAGYQQGLAEARGVLRGEELDDVDGGSDVSNERAPAYDTAGNRPLRVNPSHTINDIGECESWCDACRIERHRRESNERDEVRK